MVVKSQAETLKPGRLGKPVASGSDLRLHIERLVLDGVPLAMADGPRFQAALEQELGRLLGADGGESWSGAAIARLDAGAIHLVPGGSAQVWGRQVAGSLFSILKSESRPRPVAGIPSAEPKRQTTGGMPEASGRELI